MGQPPKNTPVVYSSHRLRLNMRTLMPECPCGASPVCEIWIRQAWAQLGSTMLIRLALRGAVAFMGSSATRAALTAFDATLRPPIPPEHRREAPRNPVTDTFAGRLARAATAIPAYFAARYANRLTPRHGARVVPGEWRDGQ